MRFAGLKVKRVFDEIEHRPLTAEEFKVRVEGLTKIELRQLGRLLLAAEKAKKLESNQHLIQLLRRSCRP
jgi:hypothetical protein